MSALRQTCVCGLYDILNTKVLYKYIQLSLWWHEYFQWKKWRTIISYVYSWSLLYLHNNVQSASSIALINKQALTEIAWICILKCKKQCIICTLLTLEVIGPCIVPIQGQLNNWFNARWQWWILSLYFFGGRFRKKKKWSINRYSPPLFLVARAVTVILDEWWI